MENKENKNQKEDVHKHIHEHDLLSTTNYPEEHFTEQLMKKKPNAKSLMNKKQTSLDTQQSVDDEHFQEHNLLSTTNYPEEHFMERERNNSITEHDAPVILNKRSLNTGDNF